MIRRRWLLAFLLLCVAAGLFVYPELTGMQWRELRLKPLVVRSILGGLIGAMLGWLLVGWELCDGNRPW